MKDHKIVAVVTVNDSHFSGLKGTWFSCKNTLWKNSETTSDVGFQEFLENSRE